MASRGHRQEANMKNAKELDLTEPQLLLAQAEEVIE
jgi:hypothetical protein